MTVKVFFTMLVKIIVCVQETKYMILHLFTYKEYVTLVILHRCSTASGLSDVYEK